MSWYFVITEEMRSSLGLKGNELLVFAIINGYSQSRQGCFHGSLAYLQELTGAASKRTIINALKELVSKGYIVKRDIIVDGVRRVLYSVADGWCKNYTGGSAKNAQGGSAKNAPNNKDIDIKNKTIRGQGFVKPNIDEVRAYCLERGNTIDPEAFVAYYESKGWKVGNAPMRDWKAAVITWERRRKENDNGNKSSSRLHLGEMEYESSTL